MPPQETRRIHQYDRPNMVEILPGSGRIISLSEIVDYYFPEGSYPPRNQMRGKLLFLNQLFQPSEISFKIASDILTPLIGEQVVSQSPPTISNIYTDSYNSISPRSGAFNILWQMTEGPNIKLTVPTWSDLERVRKVVTTGLEKVCTKTSGTNTNGEDLYVDEIDPSEIRLTRERRRVFRMPRTQDQVSVEALGLESDSVIEKTPFIVVEWDHLKSVSLKLVVDTIGDGANVQHFSPIRTLFALKIESREPWMMAPNRDNIISWDKVEASWVIDEGEPYALLPSDSLKVLSAPMEVDIEDLRNMRDPKSYLELVMTAAKMVYKAVTCQDNLSIINGNGFNSLTISDETLDKFRKAFALLAVSPSGQIYNPLQQSIYGLIGDGRDVCKDLDYFTYLMTEAAIKDPDKFLEYAYALGLDNVLPLLKKVTTEDLVERVKKKDLVFLTRLFNLLPDLTPHVDHRPSRQLDRQDTYFMQICTIGANDALTAGEEPFASAVVKNNGSIREIIAVAHNEIEGRNDPTQHAEIIAMERAQEVLGGDRTLTECELYTTVEPCPLCSFAIRTRSGIKRVVCGVASPTMGGETRFGHILTDPTLKEQGYPFGDPPEVVIGVLQDEVLKIYKEVGYRTMFPNLR